MRSRSWLLRQLFQCPLCHQDVVACVEEGGSGPWNETHLSELGGKLRKVHRLCKILALCGDDEEVFAVLPVFVYRGFALLSAGLRSKIHDIRKPFEGYRDNAAAFPDPVLFLIEHVEEGSAEFGYGLFGDGLS